MTLSLQFERMTIDKDVHHGAAMKTAFSVLEVPVSRIHRFPNAILGLLSCFNKLMIVTCTIVFMNSTWNIFAKEQVTHFFTFDFNGNISWELPVNENNVTVGYTKLEKPGCCSNRTPMTEENAESEEVCVSRCEQNQCFRQEQGLEIDCDPVLICNFYSWDESTKACRTYDTCSNITVGPVESAAGLLGECLPTMVTYTNIPCKHFYGIFSWSTPLWNLYYIGAQ